MTNHEFALSDLAARLAGTDASLSTALRDILAVALQELIESELTSAIGAETGAGLGEPFAVDLGGSAGVDGDIAVAIIGVRGATVTRWSQQCIPEIGSGWTGNVRF